MKTLYVVRHAKSSWDYPDLSDFDRPLGPRGERDAPRMGKYLKTKGIIPKFILSSPANRALTTATNIASSIGYIDEIGQDKRIYHADENMLLRVLKEQNDDYQSLMIFGHNPGFTDLVNSLANQSIINIPTCGACQVDFPIEQWSQLSFGTGSLIFFQYPKGL